jgi:hypothetical protein
MTSQTMMLNSITQRSFVRQTSGLQKGAEVITAVLMIAAFFVWFLALGA